VENDEERSVCVDFEDGAAVSGLREVHMQRIIRREGESVREEKARDESRGSWRLNWLVGMHEGGYRADATRIEQGERG